MYFLHLEAILTLELKEPPYAAEALQWGFRVFRTQEEVIEMKGNHGDLLIGIVIGAMLGGTYGTQLSTLLPTLVPVFLAVIVLVYGLKFLGVH